MPEITKQLTAISEANFSNMKVAEVRVSDDAGKTWYMHHAFDHLSANAEMVAAGGTKNTVHVAVLRSAANITGMNKHDGCMVIRSFTPGEWPSPKSQAPAWFKEEKLAEPTKENF